MITDELLIDYLLGETTTEEKMLVEQWLNENEANMAHFSQLKQVWENSSTPVAATTLSEHEAWTRFQQRVAEPRVKTMSLNTGWLRAAAILLLVAGIGILAYFFNMGHKAEPVPEITEAHKGIPVQAQEQVAKAAALPIKETHEETPPRQEQVAKTVEPPEQKGQLVKKAKPTNIILASNNKPIEKKKSHPLKLATDCQTKKFICNSTSCPLEICIIQKSSCEKDKPYAISNCSIIEPDQSGQLCYKAKDEQFYRNCGLTIEEIRIKRVSTGETIVLNEHSKPLTAQEFFNYITGKKKGEIVAGAFESDCDNVCTERDLKLNNSYGGLLIQ